MRSGGAMRSLMPDKEKIVDSGAREQEKIHGLWARCPSQFGHIPWCVILDKVLNFLEPQFPQLQNKGIKN